MVIIYVIEDINDLKYIGKTTRKLHDRWRRHVSDKYNPKAKKCSSYKLNLLNSIIIPLEECKEVNSKEREQYWINKLDCVNILKLNGVNKERKKTKDREYYQEKRKELDKNMSQEDRDRKNAREREYRKKNREKINARKRELRKLKKEQSKLKSTE